jgi:ABC-type multidrug transport system fused ATPase/permease subunit
MDGVRAARRAARDAAREREKAGADSAAAKRESVIGLLRDPTFRSFFAMVGRHRWLYALTIGTQLAGTGLSLAFAEASRRLFNAAPHIPPTLLSTLLWAFALISLLRLGVSFVGNWAGSLLNESVVYALRRRVLDHLQRLPLSFHEDNHSSNAVNIVYNELETTKNFVVSDVQRLIALPLSFVAAGTYLFTIHPLLGAVALTIGPLQLLSNLVQKKRFQEAIDARRKVTRDVFHTIGESLHGVREVKANQLEARVDARMAEIQARGVAQNVLVTQLSTLRSMARDLPGEVGYVAGVAAGAWLMGRGMLGAGGLIAFITLLDKVAAPFTTVVGIINNLQQTVAGSRRLFEVMEMPAEAMDRGESLAPRPDGAGPDLAFDAITFSYTPERTTLDRVTFAVPSGASLALVGPSGAGKSTVVKLLLRFYEPKSGSILLDGRPLTDYRIDSLRGSIALVSQDIFIFDGTVADNIAAGRDGATREQVERAARLAQAAEFIEKLPDGYESQVGERGIKLSHGQKQRLAIARAILRDARVLILDEPTSALDVETEASFQRDLGAWADRCTKIVIAHRLTTIRDADLVAFLEDGRVAEFGPPSELLAAGGRFAAYWHRQSLTAVAA